MYIGSTKVDGDEAYWVCNTSGTSPTPAASSKAKKSKAKKKKKSNSDDDDDDDSAFSGSDDDDDVDDADGESASSSGPRMEFRKVRIVPGLYKLFDEILVNAADNKQRDTPKHIMTSQRKSRHTHTHARTYYTLLN